MIASLVIGIISFGIRYSFGIFFNSLETQFGLSRAATSGIFSTYMLLAGAVSIVGGWALDRYGPKKVALVMGISTSLSLLVSSQASAPWQLYMTYSILLAFGTGALFAIVNSTTSRWFAKKRGIAVGITSSAGAMGEVILAPLSALLLLHFDWRVSFIILGAIAFIILVPVSQLLKRDPGEIGLMPDGIVPEASLVTPSSTEPGNQHDGLTLSESCKTRQFWFLVMIWLLLAISVHMILTHIVPHAMDLGIAPMDAAFIISLVGVGAILGRITEGRLSDSIGRKPPAIASAIIQVVTLVLLIYVRQLWMFYVVALFYGYAWGGLGTQVTLLVGDIFGLRSIGANMGAITAGWNVGAALGPVIGGLTFDAIGSYSAAFAIAAGGMVLATILSILINPRKAISQQDYKLSNNRDKLKIRGET